MERLPDYIIDILQRLNNHGYEAYVVGGAVRNMLLGIPVSDYDITSSADPNAIRLIFSDYPLYDLGKKHGTVVLSVNHMKIEITPFRKESDYRDHRHPESVEFTDELKDDLIRRDLTINAMCLDKDNTLVDLFDGVKDLERKIIRTVGSPEERFHEDALRVLRTIRFASRLDFAMEEKTRAALFKCAHLLKYISPERKRAELIGILSGKNINSLIREYQEIFDTFIHLKNDSRVDLLSDAIYRLALLSKGQDNDFRELKYSGQEISLIEALWHAIDINVSDDYSLNKEMSDFIHQKDLLLFLSQLHSIDLKERFKENEPYFCDVNSLSISGDELMKMGYQGKAIRKVKEELVDAIHHKTIPNTHESIRMYLMK